MALGSVSWRDRPRHPSANTVSFLRGRLATRAVPIAPRSRGRTTVDTPPTHRVADGSSVAFPVAIEAWAEEAVTILRQTATAYLSVITYGELGESVQEHSGIRTRSLLVNWIGTVLENVARCCHEDGELLLTALCVHQDGTVGSDYAGAASILKDSDRTTRSSMLPRSACAATRSTPATCLMMGDGRSSRRRKRRGAEHGRLQHRPHAAPCTTSCSREAVSATTAELGSRPVIVRRLSRTAALDRDPVARHSWAKRPWRRASHDSTARPAAPISLISTAVAMPAISPITARRLAHPVRTARSRGVVPIDDGAGTGLARPETDPAAGRACVRECEGEEAGDVGRRDRARREARGAGVVVSVVERER